MASFDTSPQRPSGQRPAEPKPVESVVGQPAPTISGYTDAEARDIYACAAEIQSQTVFEDDRLTPEMLQRSANRAGISDAALEGALKARETERQQAAQSEKLRAHQKAQRKLQLVASAVALTLIVSGTALVTQVPLMSGAAKVEAAQTQLDNVLEERHSLIPNLLSVTQNTLKNQRALIEKLRAADAATQKAATPAEKSAAETQLGETISQTLDALKSGTDGNSPTSLGFDREITPLENRLAAARRKYNLAATAYNRLASTFPMNLTRRISGYRARYEGFQTGAGVGETPKF